jgi:hypothetical protein
VSEHILAASIAVANEVESNLLDTPSLLSQPAPSKREPNRVIRFIWLAVEGFIQLLNLVSPPLAQVRLTK